MLDSFLALVPVSEVGFFGTKRDEHTLTAHVYMDRMPTDITCACLVASPEGVEAFESATARLGISARLFVATVDDGLNNQGYITPGLGDAGDRLFGAY